MFHCNGWCFTWAVTAVGGTHVCLRKVDSAAIWGLFDDEGVTHYCGAPTVHIALVNHPAAHRLRPAGDASRSPPRRPPRRCSAEMQRAEPAAASTSTG